jgi:spore maturation protein CgeB
MFQPGKEVVAYYSADDLVDKIKYYLSRETERESIAKAGQKACLERHGYDKRIKEFERILARYC